MKSITAVLLFHTLGNVTIHLNYNVKNGDKKVSFIEIRFYSIYIKYFTFELERDRRRKRESWMNLKRIGNVMLEIEK